MTRSNIIPVKYLFLDVVAYTKGTIEAQCYIIETLNRLVKGAVYRYHINDDSVIYIPTGDGMCIALLGVDLLYDIHVTIAKEILRRVEVNNSRVKSSWRKFKVRMGINQGDDNIVIDVNGRENVAGAGINNARRIMDLADASQILVSSPVYENLHPRKEYHRAFSPELRHEVKHGFILKMHQLVKPDADYLDVNLPSRFIAAPPKPEPKLTKLAAYYLAHSLKNENFILRMLKEGVSSHNWLKLLVWHLAKESERLSEKKPFEVNDYSIMPKTGSSNIEGHFAWFNHSVPSDIAINLVWVVLDNAMHPLKASDYFEQDSIYSVVNSKGKQKLYTDWPEIWDEFGLDKVSGWI